MTPESWVLCLRRHLVKFYLALVLFFLLPITKRQLQPRAESFKSFTNTRRLMICLPFHKFIHHFASCITHASLPSALLVSLSLSSKHHRDANKSSWEETLHREIWTRVNLVSLYTVKEIWVQNCHTFKLLLSRFFLCHKKVSVHLHTGRNSLYKELLKNSWGFLLSDMFASPQPWD